MFLLLLRAFLQEEHIYSFPLDKMKQQDAGAAEMSASCVTLLPVYTVKKSRCIKPLRSRTTSSLLQPSQPSFYFRTQRGFLGATNSPTLRYRGPRFVFFVTCAPVCIRVVLLSGNSLYVRARQYGRKWSIRVVSLPTIFGYVTQVR